MKIEINHNEYHGLTVAQMYASTGKSVGKDVFVSRQKRRRESLSIVPEICRENLLLFKSVLNKCNIKFWLLYGTCLGAVRDNKFIANDLDTDVGIHKIDNKQILSMIQELESVGFRLIKILEPDAAVSFMRKDEYIDVDMFRVDKTGMWAWAIYRFRKDHFSEFRTIKFLDSEFLVPLDAESYLEECYGKGWVTSDPNMTADHGLTDHYVKYKIKLIER